MANAFNNGRWVLDTANTSKLLLGIQHGLRIKQIKWEPNAAADTLVIKDRFGETKITETALAASPAGDIIPEVSKNMKIYGFVLHTLGGGTVYVDFKR